MRIKDFVDLFALDGYWRYKRAEKGKVCTDNSIRAMNSIMRGWIIPMWGKYHPKKLTVKEIDRSLAGAVSRCTGKKISGATKNKILSVLSELYKHLLEEGKVKINPVNTVVKCSNASQHPRSAISTNEVKMLFPDDHPRLKEIWRTQKYICAFLILRDTGIRPGELAALKWRDWNPGIRFFPITKAIEAGSRGKEKGTKTGSTKPAIVSPQTASELENLKKKVKPKPDDYIFANKHGAPYSTHRLSFNFHQAVERAGLNRPDLTPYWLRHTFNTRALETLPDDLVRHLMGHSTSGMTQHYRHADAESLAREAERITSQVSEIKLF